MSKTFPELLKRSRFVQYDPTITRVYTSTPSSIAAHGDWGLKFPVYRESNAPNIKVRQLDGGPAVRQEWRSAEREARFMSMWGDGRVPWSARGDRRRPRRSANAFIAEEPETTDAVASLLPNVEAMSPKEFDRYLASIREKRGELASALSESQGLSADETLAHASAKGLIRDSAASDFQAQQVKNSVSEPTSERTHQKPHRLHGLAYSSAPAAGAQLDPQRVHTGRVLDQAPRGGAHYRGIDGVNAEWVVGLGGLTAVGGSGTLRVTDRPTLSRFDYNRERKHAGLARFAVTEASVDAPPTVLGLNGKYNYVAPWLERASGARRPQPFHSFRFDVKVAQTEPVRPGRATWVGREPATSVNVGKDANLGVLGGPRALRQQGAGHKAAQRLATKVQAESIDSLLARIVGTKQ